LRCLAAEKYVKAWEAAGEPPLDTEDRKYLDAIVRKAAEKLEAASRPTRVYQGPMLPDGLPPVALHLLGRLIARGEAAFAVPIYPVTRGQRQLALCVEVRA
jgi:hypothetical protein